MVVDLWVNAISKEMAERFLAKRGFGSVEGFFGSDVASGNTNESLLAEMDRLGVDRAVLTGSLTRVDEEALAFVVDHRDRLLFSLVADDPQHPRKQSADIRARHTSSPLDLIRVSPLLQQYPLNHALYYPVYATCEELGIPVSINIGIPGPRVRSRCQDPVHLEDILIDFPDLVVIGAHMGHPYEELLIEYLLKWNNLYLSNSAYSAKYLHPGLLAFMGSSRGIGRVLFASDHPFFPMERALTTARALPLEEKAMAEFLGGAAARIFDRPDGV